MWMDLMKKESKSVLLESRDVFPDDLIFKTRVTFTPTCLSSFEQQLQCPLMASLNGYFNRYFNHLL